MRLSVIARLAPLLVALPLFGEPMVGLTSGSLVRFDSATPGTFTSGPTAITGVTAGYTVVAIDRRPATGQLYALTFNVAAVGTEMQVYIVDETSGAAIAAGSAFPAPNAIGSTLNAATRFSFDFSPTSDVLRVNSTGRDNFRVSPITGTVLAADTILTPAGTLVAGSAYANNVSGAPSTTLYAIDTSTNPDQLVIIGGNPVPPGASPNGGVTTVVGPLGVDTSGGDLGFEITSAGTALAAMAVGGTSGLFTINTGTGAATLIGTFQGAAIVTGLTSGFSAPAPPSEPMVGLTSTSALVGFDSATPGTFTSGPTAITGITAGYTVVAIDRRPATGQLYALMFNFAAVGNEMQVYTVNETTGAATAVGSAFAAPNAIGSTLNAATRFGFDFSPVSDVLRVNSTGRDNFRFNPVTGVVIAADTILTPASMQVAGDAHSNNVPGAPATTLYAINPGASPDQLVIIGGDPVPPGASPNGGVTTVVGPLGPLNSTGELGFDITPSGNALAAMSVGGTSGLYAIDVATGAASLIGSFQGGAIVTGLTSALATPTLTTQASAGVIIGGNVNDDATLAGGTNPTGTITFNLYGPNDATCTGAAAFTAVIPVAGNGLYNSGNFAPALAGTYRWVASYSGDGNNVPVTSPCNAPNESVVVSPASPTLTTQASPSVFLGGNVNDDATLAGGVNPTGTITFNLYGPNDGTCTGGIAFTAAIPVTGNGVHNSGNFAPASAGTYRWVASYSGDANNLAATSPCNSPNESVVVNSLTVSTLTTQASPNVSLGGSINDSATLAGGTTPTGTITFDLYGPDDATCTGGIAFTATIPVTGNGVYNSGNFTPASTGTYRWVAGYSGDASNAPVVSPCNAPNESVVVSPLGVTVSGTKTAAAGPYTVGGNVTYTIVLTNSGLGTQADNAGDELVDVLPPALQLVSANATSGTAVATVGTNTVTWNGSIAPAGSVTITITATILPSAYGTTVSNQGTINYDADNNGTNESTAPTDDPAVGGAGDPTSIAVAANGAIPTLSPLALLLMCGALAGIAWMMLPRAT